MPSFTLTRGRAVLAVTCGLALVFAASHLFDQRPSPARTVVPPLAAPAKTSPAPASVLVVDVAGAVRRPGLYRLRQGSRIADAIARAGGPTARGETTLVNLAAPLADGEQVLVPGRGAAGAAGGLGGGSSSSAPVDLNSATAEQLDALPGIGPVTAQKIVDYRQEHGPFTSVDDLDAIPGIGPARIANLKGLVLP
jgi:competence protein ComEA